MQAKLDEETGTASIGSKVWYYNGVAGEDLSVQAERNNSSLLIDFNRQVALNSLAGNIEVSFTNANGENVRKSFADLKGKFSEDNRSFKLNMNDVIKNLDGKNVPSGNAVINLKVGGFVCAEGSQNGRAIPAFEVRNIRIQPLYSEKDIYFSTSGYSTSSRIEFNLNGEITLDGGEYTVTGIDSSSNSYSFKANADGRKLLLTPVSGTAPADGTKVDFKLTNILVKGQGHSYSTDVSVTFTRYLAVMDGNEDDNYLKAPAVSVTDAEGDSEAFTWSFSNGDLTKISVLNDDDNLYVALSGNLATTYNDGIAVLVSKNHTDFDMLSETEIKEFFTNQNEGTGIADTITYGRDTLKHGKPDFVLVHKPQSGELNAWVNNNGSAENVSTSIQAGNKSFESAGFVEYAIPRSELTKAGIGAGDKIYLAGLLVAAWGDGNAVADIVPDSAASFNENHNNVVFNFQKGLEYTIQ